MAVLRLWRTSDQKTNRIFENIFGVEDSESEIIFPKFEFFMPVLGFDRPLIEKLTIFLRIII
jgi:hypothetical protein